MVKDNRPTPNDAETTQGVPATGPAETATSAASEHTAVPLSSSDAGQHGRFVPGTTAAGRYRIVPLLGRGGMGEVYRADDLTLGQPVALKFLPGRMVSTDSHVQQLYDEVRMARKVSHPNVCRVFDIAETDGQRTSAHLRRHTMRPRV